MARIVVNLDLQAVGAGGGGGERHGLHVAGVAGGVARVRDDRQVREVVDHGDGVQVEGVAGARLVRADAAFAEYDVIVALAHDVLSRHEEFVHRA